MSIEATAAPAAPVTDAPTRSPNAPTTEEIAAVKALTEANRKIDQGDGDDNVETEEQIAARLAAKQKTPEERELARRQRAIDSRTKRLGKAEAERDHYRSELERLTAQPIERNNRASADDSEPVSLTRAQLREMVAAEARAIAEQQPEVKRRLGVVEVLAKTWGKERFDELSSDLDDAFGGLADRTGAPRAATEAVFEADDPKAVIEYLADPENLDEAERISRLGPVQAGKAIAKLEATLKTTAASAKPRPSTAPAPLEPVRGQGTGREKRLGELSGDAFNKRRAEQIAARKGY